MNKASEHWKELRPQIGAFVSELNGLYKDAENIDEATSRAYEKGFKDGFKEDKKEVCKDCMAREFFDKCNGFFDVIRKFMELDWKNRNIVVNMINALSEKENK